jgi:hopanoid-associated phosphorylase
VTVLAVVGLIREAKIVATEDVRAVIGGGQSELLAERLKTALTAGARGVISIGIGGGLDPALEVGETVIADKIVWLGGEHPTDAAWTARLKATLPVAHVAPIFGADVMVLEAGEKARLRALSGAAAVDMESRTASSLAADFNVPFAALRVVSDSAGMTLPSAVLSGMTPDGGMNLIGVLAALAREPKQLPALIRVGGDSEIAFKTLALIRLALGPDLAYSAA